LHGGFNDLLRFARSKERGELAKSTKPLGTRPQLVTVVRVIQEAKVARQTAN
jgi:hypothetical protein